MTDASILPSVRVGRTDVYVSRIGLGTVPIGLMYEPISDEQALATVRAALDAGIAANAAAAGPCI